MDGSENSKEFLEVRQKGTRQTSIGKSLVMAYPRGIFHQVAATPWRRSSTGCMRFRVGGADDGMERAGTR